MQSCCWTSYLKPGEQNQGAWRKVFNSPPHPRTVNFGWQHTCSIFVKANSESHCTRSLQEEKNIYPSLKNNIHFFPILTLGYAWEVKNAPGKCFWKNYILGGNVVMRFLVGVNCALITRQDDRSIFYHYLGWHTYYKLGGGGGGGYDEQPESWWMVPLDLFAAAPLCSGIWVVTWLLILACSTHCVLAARHVYCIWSMCVSYSLPLQHSEQEMKGCPNGQNIAWQLSELSPHALYMLCTSVQISQVKNRRQMWYFTHSISISVQII